MAAEEAAVAAETEMLLGTGEPIAFETAADAAVAAAHAASEPFDASDPIQPIEGFDVDPLAAAAASLDIDVEGFDAGPVALDVDPVDHASVPAAALTAETDETADLLASLRSFGGGDDFVLDAPGEADVTLDLEALAADETASEPTASVPSMSLFEDEPVFLAEPVATEPVEAVDHAAHADVDASPAALVELAPARGEEPLPGATSIH